MGTPQFPNASGFIPNESVIDGITKLVNLFGGQQKRQREANIGLTGAQTKQVNAQADAIPQNTVNDTQRVQNETDRNAELAREFNVDDPLRQRQVAVQEKETESVGKAREAQSKLGMDTLAHSIAQWGQQFQLFGQEQDRKNRETSAQIENANQANNRAWAELKQNAQLSDAQIDMMKQQAPALHGLINDLLMSSPNALNDPTQGPLLHGLIGSLLERVSPSNAAFYKKAMADQEAAKKQRLDEEKARSQQKAKEDAYKNSGSYSYPTTLMSPIMPPLFSK